MKNQGIVTYVPTAVLSMANLIRYLAIVFAVCGLSSAGLAEDITIHLPANASISRKIVQYQCDPQGPKIGVQSGPFSVEYINGGGNSLAVVPISGNSLIFSNVISGSGARYAAQQFIWWEAHGTATLYADSLSGKLQSSCQPVEKQ